MGDRGGYCVASSGDSDLSTRHVELSARVRKCGVEGDEFNTEEILSSGDTFGDRECHQALIGNESVYSPLCPRSVAVFIDLEPVKVGHIGLERRWDLGKVCQKRTFVSRINWIGQVAWILPVDRVMEFSGHLCTSWHVDDSLGYRLEVRVDSAIADEIVGSNALDGPIVAWYSDADFMSLSNTVHPEFLEDRMRICTTKETPQRCD